MLTIPVYNPAGEQVGEETIDPADFGGEINKQLLHDVVLMHLAARRVGTVNTRGRADVAGSGKKLFRQKGTGNARAGSKRTNKRKGGGVAFARRNRDYRYSMPKKAVRAAVRMAHPLQVPGRPGADPRRPRRSGKPQDQGSRRGAPGRSAGPTCTEARGGRIRRRDQGPGAASGRSTGRDRPARPARPRPGAAPQCPQHRGRRGRPGRRVQHLRRPQAALPGADPRGAGRASRSGSSSKPARRRPDRRRASPPPRPASES